MQQKQSFEEYKERERKKLDAERKEVEEMRFIYKAKIEEMDRLELERKQSLEAA